jgi:hypothetical protein
MAIPLPTPKTASELITPPADGPTPEFTAMMQDLERRSAGGPASPATTGVVVAEPLVQIVPPVIKVEDKPITLKYKYDGTCPTCHQDVSTLELDTDGKHFAVAFCLFCKKQVESREVADLTQKISHKNEKNINETTMVTESIELKKQKLPKKIKEKIESETA